MQWVIESKDIIKDIHEEIWDSLYAIYAIVHPIHTSPGCPLQLLDAIDSCSVRRNSQIDLIALHKMSAHP